MAYADINSSNRKLGTGAAVLLLEAGLGWAVIAGLTMNYTRTVPPKNPEATNFPVPKPKPPEEVTVTPQPPQPETARHIIDPPFNLGPAPLPTTAAELDDSGGVVIAEPQHVTPPIPTPGPSFAPKSARPTGKTGNWVTTNDYPTRELREGLEGTTRYRLAISAEGRVTNCSVTASSGSAGLDRAACDNLQHRARFEPATDENGTRTAGSFSGAVTWRIPEE